MKTILLIEDNNDIRELTAELLGLSGYLVQQAENGKIGVEMAFKSPPDLVICDIMMPVLDGFGVLHIFHQNESLQTVPFIFLTAKTERIDFRKGMEMGADDYITKPFSEIELLNAIERRLKRSNQLSHGQNTKERLNELFDDTKAQTELQNLIVNKKPVHYRKKQLIFAEGDAANRVFLILKGKVKTFRSNEYGKNYTTSIYSEGQYFGHLAMIENLSQPDFAEALEDTDLLAINKAAFMELLYRNQHVAARFIKLLANDVLHKEEMLAAMAYNSLRKRIADTLVQLHKKYSNAVNVLDIRISREDLASIVGTATESLIRILSEFKHDHLIDLQASEITILNLEKLTKLRA
jgi:DNA-binding response OmpR family regulator